MTVTWKTNDHGAPLEGLCSQIVEEIAYAFKRAFLPNLPGRIFFVP